MNAITGEQLLEAYAGAIAAYYATEKAFVAVPTAQTLHDYHLAIDRLQVLREETGRSVRLVDALLADEETP